MSELYWNTARVEQLTQLIAEQKTYAVIGAIMGVSKNTALGKANRLGLMNTDPERAPTTTADRLAALNKFPGASRCVYPHGHVGEEGFGFCGERTHDVTAAYCAHHHALAWKPVDTAAMKQLNYAAGKVAMVPGLQPTAGSGLVIETAAGSGLLASRRTRRPTAD